MGSPFDQSGLDLGLEVGVKLPRGIGLVGEVLILNKIKALLCREKG